MDFSNGLLGLGGLSLGGQNPAAGLLGGYYDPAEMKRQQMKQFLLGTGIGMLSQGPSRMPIGFGETIGAGLQNGLLAANKAQEDYQKNALLGYELAQKQKEAAWQTEEQSRKKADWAREDQAVKDRNSLLSTISDPKKRAFAQAYPDQFAKSYSSELFPDQADQNTYYGTTAGVIMPDGSFNYAQPSKNGQWVVNGGPMPQGARFATPEELNAQKARGTEMGKYGAESQQAAPGQLDDINTARALLEKIKTSPYLERGTGFTSLGNMVPGTGGYDFQNLVNQAKSGAFLTAIQKMRGLGALSNQEGSAAVAAITRMDTATSQEAFMDALNDYEALLNTAESRVRQRVNAAPAGQSQTPPQGNAKTYTFNPATGELE